MLLHNQIPRVDSLAELLRFCKRLLQMRMDSIMLPVTVFLQFLCHLIVCLVVQRCVRTRI